MSTRSEVDVQLMFMFEIFKHSVARKPVLESLNGERGQSWNAFKN